MLDTLVALLFTKSFWFATFALGVFAYLKFVINGYWRRKGVPHEAPVVLFGNALSIFLQRSSLGDLVRRNYEKFRRYPFHGMYIFHKPLLVINDPEVIRLVLIKEFARFQDRGFYHNDEVDPLSNQLFVLPGKKWKLLRKKLSPTFTATRLRQMLPLIQETGEELVRVCSEMIERSDVVDVKNVTGRYTTDTICSIAYGFKNNSLRDPNNDFRRYGDMVFSLGGIKYALGAFAPRIMELLSIAFLPRHVTSFFVTAFEQAVKSRRQNNVDRNDFLGLLLQLMDTGAIESDEIDDNTNNEDVQVSDDNRISFRQALAQPFVFFLGGYETTSSTVSYCLYELALNPEVQMKLQEEIDIFTNSKEGLTYDVIINQMEYLDMVFLETLRKYPSFPVLTRQCNEDYDVPIYNYRIEKGSRISIPVVGIHYNPDIYPEPEKFDPLRFTKEESAKRDSCTYLPFGDGPRHCIANRFANLQSKVALIYLLSRFRFAICDKTPIPIVYSIKSITQTPDGPIYLRMEKRK